MNERPRPVARAFDAATSANTQAVLACFTPKGIVDESGREFRGRNEIRGWSDASSSACTSRAT
jgi:hypothetical protein